MVKAALPGHGIYHMLYAALGLCAVIAMWLAWISLDEWLDLSGRLRRLVRPKRRKTESWKL